MARLIIGMTGRRGSSETGFVQAQAGKDTAAKQLIDAHGFVQIALADGVRDSLYALDPYVSYHANGLLQFRRLSEIVNELGWEQAKRNPEVRALMQRMGTEAGRLVHGEDLWIDLVEHKIAKLGPDTPVVITDVRSPNEADWVKALGGVIVEVYRPEQLKGDLGDNAKHASETMGWITPDLTIVNSTTIPELHKQVDILMARLMDRIG